MKIEFTDHGIDRLQERGFTVDQIKKVVKNASKTKTNSDGTMAMRGKLNDGSELEVVCRKKSKNKITFITAYFL